MNRLFNVAETFSSIQGESTWAGCPCFFIRLAGCNLSCSYCDTAWAQKGGRAMAMQALLDEAKASGMRFFEVTGGEPLLQEGVPDLLRALQRFGTVLLETNGSVDIGQTPEGVHIIMDIKTPGSGESASMRWENLNLLRVGDEIKLVLCDRADYEWARDLLVDWSLAAGGRVVLLGAAAGRLSYAELAEWVLADKLPVRLNPNLHRWIWPDAPRGR